MTETVRDIMNRTFREFRRYEGDGQGGAGALPIGDPASGPHNPPKSEIRKGFGNAGDIIDQAVEDAEETLTAIKAIFLGELSEDPATRLDASPLEGGEWYVRPDGTQRVYASGAEEWSNAPQGPPGIDGDIYDFGTRGEAIAAEIPSGLNHVRTAGYTDAGDGGGALYRRAGSEPSHAGKFQSADGAWWELVDDGRLTVLQFGAVGDGASNDSPAVQAALDYAVSQGRGRVHFAGGRRYRLDDTIYYSGPISANLTISGEWAASPLLHHVEGPLFEFVNRVRHLFVDDLMIFSKRRSDVKTHTAFFFPEGNTDSKYTNIMLRTDIQAGEFNDATKVPTGLYYCEVDKLTDSVTFTNCWSWGHTRTAIHIGSGSEVRIIGGRLIGRWPLTEGAQSRGIELSGGNGGVYIVAADAINNDVNLRIARDNGTSNREVFLTHFVCDTSRVGVSIQDASYVSWTGAWCASHDEVGINYDPNSDSVNAILNIAGGTIFNGGVSDLGGAGRGINHNGKGRIIIGDVVFRNNKGRAISFNSAASARRSRIKDCDFVTNNDGGTEQVRLVGPVTFQDNGFVGSTPPVTLDAASGSLIRMSNNEGRTGAITGITAPASNTNQTNETGDRIRLYFRGGSVSSIWVNDNPLHEPAGAANVSIELFPGDTWRWVGSSAPNIQRQRL